ncbi:MAG: CCA tRNA nucleotidyltransferase [Candidatus Gracilibacteria bacterium]|nr:CCA tRNA nucleotidyltransferase [Candidatus Gracilibacteria bacterium]
MKNLISIAQKLDRIGRKAYIVGSYNVHKILNRNFGSDFDLTTPATPEEIRSVLKVTGEIGSKYGTLIIKEGGQAFEITTFRKDIGTVNHRKPAEVIFTEFLEEDAIRRDFTFNAIYYDILEDRYIDPTGGIKDLENGTIRFVGDINKRLDEDILRLLRYIRLKNKYGLNPADNRYDDIIRSRISELENISKERIKQELDKMIIDKTNIKALNDLKDLGFFRFFIPHIDNLSLTPGGKLMHKEGNVWIHVLLSIEALNRMKIKDIDIFWATLLHDIGKYSTYSYDDFGNVHYFRHELEGVKMFDDIISKDMYFSKKSARKISYLIKNHIRVGTIEQMKKIKANRFMMDRYFEDLITLYDVDNIGKYPPDLECGPRLKKMHEEFKIRLSKTDFLNGNDIIKMNPSLKGSMIGYRLKQENDKILSRI